MIGEARITPENIHTLEKNQIFVFGSNLSGRHGRGAAMTALQWGAKWGQASGCQGNTYGIPTKDAQIRRTLSIHEIQPFVEKFLTFALGNPKHHFFVTEIGCGLAGYSPDQIAPLFIPCISIPNISLPQRFWDVLFTLHTLHATISL